VDDHDKQWEAVKMVYHATNKKALSRAEQSDTLTFVNSDNISTLCPCSLFSCKLWHDRCGNVVESPSTNTKDGRPNISPYANNHVVIPCTDVLATPDDYLLPIASYPTPPADPDESHQSHGGRTYIEMLYLRHKDVKNIDGELVQFDRDYIEAWKLKNHPFVQLENNVLHYRVIHDVWWIMLTPYEVPIPSSGTIWEWGMGGVRHKKLPRKIDNPVTLKLARNITILNVSEKKNCL